jgi:hypothetical protein
MRTGQLRLSDFSEPLTLQEQKTGEISDFGFAAREQYELRATLRIMFWANRAQYIEARKHAETALMHRVFAPVLAEVAEIRKAVFDGDAHAALEACGRMQKALGL